MITVIMTNSQLPDRKENSTQFFKIDFQILLIKLSLIFVSVWITVLYSFNEMLFEAALPAAILLFLIAQLNFITSKN